MYNIVDIAIVFILVTSVIVGLFRGFIREALSVVSWIVAIWVAAKFSAPFADIIAEVTDSFSLHPGMAFAILFLLTFLAGNLLSSIFNFLVKKTGLKGADRMLGMVFGFCRGWLTVSVGIMLVDFTPFAKESWWTASSLVPKFMPIVSWLGGVVSTKLPEAAKVASLQALFF